MSTKVRSKYRMRKTAQNTEAQMEYDIKIGLTEIGINDGTLQWTLGFLNSRGISSEAQRPLAV